MARAVRMADGGLGISAGAMCSFTPDTLVSTSEGLIAIEDVALGDTVLAVHEDTLQRGEFTVTGISSHADDNLLELTIDGETIVTTTDHPFLTADGAWINAGELTSGAQIASLNGIVGTVTASHPLSGERILYDLTVDDAHTFSVGSGAWVVHNACDPARITKAEELSRVANRIKEILNYPKATIGIADIDNKRFVSIGTNDESLFKDLTRKIKDGILRKNSMYDVELLPSTPTQFGREAGTIPHAEEQLFQYWQRLHENQPFEVGISNWEGLCASCKTNFKPHDVVLARPPYSLTGEIYYHYFYQGLEKPVR